MPTTVRPGNKITVTVQLTNTGSRDGEEVVQLYVAHQQVKGKAPLRALKGFQRHFLKAGETKQISFALNAEELSLVNETDGKLYQPKGKVSISVGGGQPGVKKPTTSNVLSQLLAIQ
jgi:beta-glucosidase